MDLFFQFIGTEWIKVAALIALFGLMLFHENRKSGTAIQPAQLSALVNKSDGIVVDLREASEYSGGHITDAVNIPYKSLAEHMGTLEKYKDKPVILVCKMGQHSSAAGKQLGEAGFSQVFRLGRGIDDWVHAQLPLVKKEKAEKPVKSKKDKKGEKS